VVTASCFAVQSSSVASVVAEPTPGPTAIRRGEIWWAELPEERGSEPAGRRPVLVVQSDAFNRSRLRTVLVIALTSNVALSDMPGNVLLPCKLTGLPRDATAHVAQVLALDRRFFGRRERALPPSLMSLVDEGLRLVLSL